MRDRHSSMQTLPERMFKTSHFSQIELGLSKYISI